MKVARSPRANMAAKTPVWMMLNERDERLWHGHTYLDGTANQAIQDVVRPTKAGPRLEEAPDEQS